MLKKTASICFSLFIFSVLFFAAQTDGFAQADLRDYQEIVKDYQQKRLQLPTSREEYNRFVQAENLDYQFTLEDLNKAHKFRADSLQDSMRLCNQELTRINKKKCVESTTAAIEKDAGQYLDALQKLQKAFEERKLKLRNARIKLPPLKTRPTPIRKEYKRRTK